MAEPGSDPVRSPLEVAPLMASTGELAARLIGCVACAELAATRLQVVPGTAPAGAEVLLVGEAPGAQEDAAGVPFVGRSGALLDELLAEAGLVRERIAVTNVLKCRPPANRRPRRSEVERCRPWLSRQLALIDPLVIVSLGTSAAAWFLGPSARISALREAGEPVHYAERPLVVTYHPAAAIRFGPQGRPRAALRADLATVSSLVAQRRAARG
jgi:DNA polymerase